MYNLFLTNLKVLLLRIFLLIFPTFRESWPKGFPTLLAFMYCCSQTSIEIKNLEIRRDILAEKDREL